VKKAYGDAATYWKEALVKFVKILWRATRELGQEAVSKESTKQTELTEAEKVFNFKNIEEDKNFVGLYIQGITTTENIEVPQTLQTQANTYFDKSRKWMINQIVQDLVSLYTDEASMKQLGNDLKESGLDIVEFILQKLKNRLSEDVIIEQTKNEMVNKLFDIINKD
jgi:hypothetical protein